MEVTIRLKKADKCCEQEFPYHELIGNVKYLAASTRPDFTNSVSQFSQFLNCYDKTRWTAAKRFLRYLKKNN